MIEVFNKIHNGNAICYTIQSNISSTVKTVLPVNVQIRTLASASSYYFRYNRLQVSWIFPAGNTYYSQIIDLPREETGSVEIYGRESYYIEPYDDLDSTNINESLSANQGRVLNEKITSLTTYSTEEQVIGTWIDGKPIYRKVVSIGSLPSNQSITVNHNISNIKNIVNSSLNWFDTIDNAWLHNSRWDSPTVRISYNINSTQIWIDGAGSNWGGRTKDAYATIEYTKTTD